MSARFRTVAPFLIALGSLVPAAGCTATGDEVAAGRPASASGGATVPDSARAVDRGRGAASSRAADASRIAHSRLEDLTGDGRAERLSLEARGPRVDSLEVRLEIRSPEDSMLYRSTWSSRSYFEYVARSSMSDGAADTLVRGQLARVLIDTSFGRVGAGGFIGPGSSRSPADTSLVDMMRDAIRHDLAADDWRRANGFPPTAEPPSSAHDAIGALAKAVSAARIQAMVEELQGRRSLHFSVGGETSYAIAWSDRERRFVTIFACC